MILDRYTFFDKSPTIYYLKRKGRILNVRKKILYIVLLTMVVLTACGKTEEKKEPPKTEQTDKQEDSTESSEAKGEDSQSTPDAPNGAEVQEPSNQAESNQNESTGNSNTTTGNTTTKPSDGSTNSGSSNTSNVGNSNNSGSSNNNSGSNNTGSNSGSTTTQPSTPVHEHNWVEVTEDEIHYYAWRTICGKCGTDMTDMTSTDKVYHSSAICSSRYSTEYIEVDFVTENVVKTPVVTGYKCECGAEKK
ncbi:MAG: hypothetical protein IJA19_05850 [Clostridia bacterium]|nr:hypothetical protein [Clostridia bacterium]